MALLSLRDVHMNFGTAEVLDGVTLQIEPGERVCLIGRNGEGKSTLMAIMNGDLEPVNGQIIRTPGLKITMLDQKVPTGLAGTVFEVVSRGLGARGKLLQEYHDAGRELANTGSSEAMAKLDRIQHKIEVQDAWHVHQQVETVISHLKLDADAQAATLSAGLKRRLLLAKALVMEPDILLLDEPTNHLDVDSIVWLEEFLEKFPASLVFVTHDRMFLRKLSTRIVDIDRGCLTSWSCDYDEFVKRKQAFLDAEAAEQSKFDKKLAVEEAWIRKGIKARRRRNEGRVRELIKMRQQRRQRRRLVGKVNIQAQEAELSGELVIDAKGIDFFYKDTPQPDTEPVKIIDNFTTMIMRGDKFGVIGPNGTGKTTLLKVLLGELRPTDGTIRKGTKLAIAYFDQLHAQLDESKSVWENVADGYSSININGSSRNVVGYLQDFLFTPEQAKKPVSTLSGGERNRLLLARLFAKPSNVLVLDEPTNDLDMETLELLEELLVEYNGTVLLVSHDRAFLNNVVTGTFAIEGEGKIKEYVGGYDDWLHQKSQQVQLQEEKPVKKEKPARSKPAAEPDGKRKLSYKEQKELEALPLKIEGLEERIAECHGQMADPAFYKQSPEAIAQAAASVQRMEEELKEAYQRWEQLEG